MANRKRLAEMIKCAECKWWDHSDYANRERSIRTPQALLRRKCSHPDVGTGPDKDKPTTLNWVTTSEDHGCQYGEKEIEIVSKDNIKYEMTNDDLQMAIVYAVKLSNSSPTNDELSRHMQALLTIQRQRAGMVTINGE